MMMTVNRRISSHHHYQIFTDTLLSHAALEQRIEYDRYRGSFQSLLVWSRRLRFDWHRDKKCQAPPLEFTGHMRSTFLVRNNFRHRRDIENAYLQAINQAQSEIILANAYFLPGRNFRHALLRAASRGVVQTLGRSCGIRTLSN